MPERGAILKTFVVEIMGWPHPNGGPYVKKETWQASSEFEFLGMLKDNLKTRGFKCRVVLWREVRNA